MKLILKANPLPPETYSKAFWEHNYPRIALLNSASLIAIQSLLSLEEKPLEFQLVHKDRSEDWANSYIYYFRYENLKFRISSYFSFSKYLPKEQWDFLRKRISKLLRFELENGDGRIDEDLLLQDVD